NLLFADENGIVIDSTKQMHRFGVDGTAIGRSDRTDSWVEYIDPNDARRTRKIAASHTWEPDTFDQRLVNLRALGKRVEVVMDALASVAKWFLAIFGF